jgi:hypothetical protein
MEFIFANTGEELEKKGMWVKGDPQNVIVCRSYDSSERIYINKKKCTKRQLLEVVIQSLCLGVTDDETEEQIVFKVSNTLKEFDKACEKEGLV